MLVTSKHQCRQYQNLVSITLMYLKKNRRKQNKLRKENAGNNMQRFTCYILAQHILFNKKKTRKQFHFFVM